MTFPVIPGKTCSLRSFAPTRTGGPRCRPLERPRPVAVLSAGRVYAAVLFAAVAAGGGVEFFERTLFWMEPGFTLFSYVNFFTSARFENFLWSIAHSSVSVLVCFVLGFPIAVFVRRRVSEAAQHRVILLFILPFMVSEVIRIFMLRPVLGRNGLVNGVLLELGLIDQPLTALLFTPVGVIIGEVLSFLPFIVFAVFWPWRRCRNIFSRSARTSAPGAGAPLST